MEDERLIRIETDIVYLQDTIRELNEIVSAQQAAITKLEKQNEALNRRMEEMDSETRPNRRPPHY